jgi:hypothetical protein
MTWRIETVELFDQWWATLGEPQRISVVAILRVLEERGPALGRPYVDQIKGSRHQNMKELRVQHRGRPLRILFAFDVRRAAILLIGGDKSGDKGWYDVHVPMADEAFDRHLRSLKKATPKPEEK